LSTLEREREIGILKLIGASPRWILTSFLLEGIITGLMAGILGFIAGIYLVASPILSLISQQLMDVQLSYNAGHLSTGLVVGVITIIIAMIYPAIRGSRTPVIRALHYE